MAAKPRKEFVPGQGRSPAQQWGSSAMVLVMCVWEELTEEEYLTWRVAANSRRMQGVTYFKSVNLRRVRRGDPVLRLPPPSRTYDPRPLLKRLIIGYQRGRITLKLELHRLPGDRTTVWASLPCNRGRANPFKCPRLGWLPTQRGKLCDITRLYFEKHGEHMRAHHVPLVGKRIFVRVRLEVDEGAALYEQVSAVVHPPPGWEKP
jgi:hypothetical protein